MGVRSTQLTTKQTAFQKLSLIMICSKIYKIYINVEMCEMCRPDTHALYLHNQYDSVARPSPNHFFGASVLARKEEIHE